MIKVRALLNSLRHAWRGFKVAAEENTFRLLLTIAFAVTALLLFLPLKSWERISLVLATMMVLVLEILNSVFERIADLVEPKVHTYVKDIKDLMAAAVLIASLAALVIGTVVLLPYLLAILEQ